MNRILALIGLLIAAGILFELHGINRRLDSAAVLAPFSTRPTGAALRATETPAQRKTRLDAEAEDLKRWQADYDYLTDHSKASGASRQTSPR